MAKDWGQIGGIAGVVGGVATIIGLGFTAQQYYFGTIATTQIDDVKGCNGFLIKEKPVALSTKAIPEAIEQKYLQDKILSCRDELQKNDKNAGAYTNIGEATRRLGDLPVALTAQQEAVNLAPNLQEAKLGLALVQADMGKTAEANKTIQDALAQKESAVAYFYQGVVFYGQKDLKSAETSYRRAIDLNPSSNEAYYNLGDALRNQGKTAGAITAYQRAISINPNDARAYNNLGVALRNQGKTAEAIAAYQRAISINPNDAKAHYNLGTALYDQGKTAEAIAAYQKATSINPNDAEAYNNLGNALWKQGKTAEAITAYQNSTHLNPNDAVAYRNLAVAFANQGNLEGAISKLKKARDLYRAQGNTQEAGKITQVLERVGIR